MTKLNEQPEFTDEELSKITKKKLVKAIQDLRKMLLAQQDKIYALEQAKYEFEHEKRLRLLLKDLIQEIVGFKIPNITVD